MRRLMSAADFIAFVLLGWVMGTVAIFTLQDWLLRLR
jgi:hypothetical protein